MADPGFLVKKGKSPISARNMLPRFRVSQREIVRVKQQSAYPNSSNIDVNQNCSFMRKNYSLQSVVRSNCTISKLKKQLNWLFRHFQFDTLPSSVAGARVMLRRLSRSLTSLGRPGPSTTAGAGGLVTDGIPHIDSSNSLDSRIKHETVSTNVSLHLL